MPTKCCVSEEAAIDVIIKYMDHFRTDEYPPWSNDIWKQMSIDLNKKWSAECVYTNVRNDRRLILTKAREKMNVIVPTFDQNNNTISSESKISYLTESDSDNFSSYSKTEENSIENFNLILTEEEWNAIKPADTQCDVNSTSKKTKLKLKPKIWTNIIAKTFWLQFRMPCAFIFKKSTVNLASSGDSYIIKIYGVCKSAACKNTFNGYAEKFLDEKGLNIQIKTRDTQCTPHEIVKRPLNGQCREQVKNEVKIEGCSKWRKRQAKENMHLGETEPPDLPSKDVLRQAKKEAIDAQYGVKKDDGRDLIRTIEMISEDPEYRGLIHDVGSSPFYVFYSTQAQLHAYKEYCRSNKKTSSIKVDATGSHCNEYTQRIFAFFIARACDKKHMCLTDARKKCILQCHRMRTSEESDLREK